MAKNKIKYTCEDCGHIEPKWLGRCPECGNWNTFFEVAPEKAKNRYSSPGAETLLLNQIVAKGGNCFKSGLSELNRVLGGGIIKGSAILIGGEPGIGKSTLMLQAAAELEDVGNVLYISGEESPEQIKMRADRINCRNKKIHILCLTEIEEIMLKLQSLKPEIIIVDSVQTLISTELGGVPGTVNQIKYCCHELISYAKNSSAGLFLVAHVTKGGVIAGPKTIEHMVDTVLYFDHANSDIRILRPIKNRFGSTDEIGLFYMKEKGLLQIKNPSSLFMVQRNGSVPSGTAIASVYEGSRVLLVEIQALTVPAKGGISRIFSDRIDSSRVSRTAAVLEKHLNIKFSDQDIYINVAGGIRITEVGIELPLAVALYSARTGITVPSNVTLAGEISLAGEIRQIPHLEKRIKAAKDMGYSTFVAPGSENNSSNKLLSIVSTLKDSIKKIF